MSNKGVYVRLAKNAKTLKLAKTMLRIILGLLFNVFNSLLAVLKL